LKFFSKKSIFSYMFGIYYEKEFYFNNYATDVATNVFILLLSNVCLAW
jgi:hypothetical protein